MRKIFLDVGAHDGQTAREVLRDCDLFTDIWCFEPMPAQRARLGALAEDPRLKIFDFGLSNRTGEAIIYGDNTDMGASPYVSKKKRGNDRATPCELVRASDFFAEHIAPDDSIVMKLNCEGAECDIINDLLDSGEVAKVANVMIDFDVRKIPEKAHEEANLKERMRREGFDRYSLAPQVMVGKTHGRRIENWLHGLTLAAPIVKRRSLKQFLLAFR